MPYERTGLNWHNIHLQLRATSQNGSTALANACCMRLIWDTEARGFTSSSPVASDFIDATTFWGFPLVDHTGRYITLKQWDWVLEGPNTGEYRINQGRSRLHKGLQ